MQFIGSDTVASIKVGGDSIKAVYSSSGEFTYIEPWQSGLISSSFNAFKALAPVVGYQPVTGSVITTTHDLGAFIGYTPQNQIICGVWDATKFYAFDCNNNTSYTSSWSSSAAFRCRSLCHCADGYSYGLNFGTAAAGTQANFIKFAPAQIKTSFSAISYVGGDTGRNYYYTCAKGNDGNLYGFPTSTAWNKVIKFDVASQTTSFISASFTNLGGNSICVSHPNGKMYALDATGHVKWFDPVALTSGQIGSSGIGGANSFSVGPDGNFYAVGRNDGANKIALSNAARTVLGSVGESIGGCFGADGRYYQIPFWTPKEFKGFDPYTGVSVSGSLVPANKSARTQNGILHPDGCIYIPNTLGQLQVLRLQTSGSASTYGYINSPLAQFYGG